MKFDVTVVRKAYYNFTVEAETEDDAVEAAYDAYSKAVDDGTLGEHYGDEDLDYEYCFEADEEDEDEE